MEIRLVLSSESYDDFIGRVLPNELACHVKLADLADNMDLTRIPNPSKEDETRIQKYKQAADRILDAKKFLNGIDILSFVLYTDTIEDKSSFKCFATGDAKAKYTVKKYFATGHAKNK